MVDFLKESLREINGVSEKTKIIYKIMISVHQVLQSRQENQREACLGGPPWLTPPLFY